MSTTTHTRVSYPNMPQDTATPQDVAELIGTTNHRGTIHDLKAVRSRIHDAIQADEIADRDMRSAFSAMEALNKSIQQKEEERSSMQAKASAAPAYVRSTGDSFGSLAQSFSITRAIDQVANNRSLTGAESEAYEEAKREYPGARGSILIPARLRAELRNVYGNDSGQSGIDAAVTGKQTLNGANLQIARHFIPMAEQMGARRIDATGAATMLIPYLGRTDASTANEGAAATSSSSFEQLSLSPSRYTRKTSVSALAMATTGQQLDSILLADFDRAHAAAHDKVAFAAIRDNATFTNSTTSGSDMAATSLADIFNLQQDTMNATGVSGYFDLLASPLGMNVLNTLVATNTDQTLGQVFVSQTGRRIVPIVSMVDANLAASDVLAGNTSSDDIAGAGHLVAGDMSACILASWGGLSLMIDPYSLRDEHVMNVHADSYVAAGIVSDAFRILAVSDSAITPA